MKDMSKMCGANTKYIDLGARMLIAVVFLMGGLGKLMNPSGTVEFMQAFGIPMAGLLVWAAAVYLVAASVLLVVGWKKCMVALSLALYTLLVTVIFHSNLADQNQLTLFLKNVGLIGGLLMVMNSCNKLCWIGGKEHKKHENAE